MWADTLENTGDVVADVLEIEGDIEDAADEDTAARMPAAVAPVNLRGGCELIPTPSGLEKLSDGGCGLTKDGMLIPSDRGEITEIVNNCNYPEVI